MPNSIRRFFGKPRRETFEPGSPRANGSIESFDGKLRAELLNGEIFDTLLEGKALIERWRVEFNTIRPHSSLGYRPPAPETIQTGKSSFTTLRWISPPEHAEELTENRFHPWGQVSLLKTFLDGQAAASDLHQLLQRSSFGSMGEIWAMSVGSVRERRTSQPR